MPSVAAWRYLAKDTVTLAAPSSLNRAGEATYGTATTYQAHCQGKVQRVTDATGQERISTVTTYVIGTVAATTKWQITLPSRFSPSQPPIIAVGQHTGDQGWHHTVIYT